ncbi:hypothetical protein GIB67_019272 [Kingdonia uniflora]|uniref:RING-type domain-containing protein n=1 Tax=Kingdonia uniflora TaxID=39325 RepID=A0A7J7N039_9MAGN|nr:hypothetical protein GIB67_019272 [Kingdonia uniflora]
MAQARRGKGQVPKTRGKACHNQGRAQEARCRAVATWGEGTNNPDQGIACHAWLPHVWSMLGTSSAGAHLGDSSLPHSNLTVETLTTTVTRVTTEQPTEALVTTTSHLATTAILPTRAPDPQVLHRNSSIGLCTVDRNNSGNYGNGIPQRQWTTGQGFSAKNRQWDDAEQRGSGDRSVYILVRPPVCYTMAFHEGRKTEMLGSGMNLITTVIGFGMSATFIVFVCTRLICGRIRAAESGPVFELDDSITDLEQCFRALVTENLFDNVAICGVAEHRIGGLEPVLVAALPTMKFNRADFQSAEDAQCTICLGEYQEKEVLRIMPKCGHNFHLVCIDVWLRKQSTCPVCRLPLQDVFETKHLRSPMFGAVLQSMDQPHSLIEYPHQWSLPSREPSSENGNNGNPGPIGNSERTVNVETENRR